MNLLKKNEYSSPVTLSTLEENWEQLWSEYEWSYICRLPEWYGPEW